MSNLNSSLPVLTLNNGDVVVNVSDGTVQSQKLAIDASGRVTSKLNDGAGNSVTSQTNGAQRALDVGIDVAGVQIDPRSIRSLTAADVVTANQGTAGASQWLTKDGSDGPVTPGTVAGNSSLIGGQFNTALPTLTTGQQSAVQLDSSGRLIINIGASSGTVAVTQSTTPWVTSDLADGSVTPGTAGTKSLLGGVIAASAALTATAGQQYALQGDLAGNLKVNLETSIPAGSATIGNVGVTNLPTIVDTNYGTVGASTIRTAAEIGNSTGAANFNNGATGAQTLRVAANLAVAGADVSVANPVPVTITSASAGTPIQQYLTSASLAAGASITLTYTVPTGHTFSLERIWASCEARIFVTASIGATNLFSGFNSSAFPNIDFTVTAPPTLAATTTVNVTFTNNDKGASDVFATIEGNQLT